jgi:hypothetical protein
MGELWCGGCGAAQQRSAWQWWCRCCGIAWQRDRAREQRTRTIVHHGSLEAPPGLTCGPSAGVRSSHGRHSLASVGHDGQPEMAIRPR